ncbi:adhesive plaque matrix protein-like [Haliotis rufescens]|uniref:adhesive plaque matrix protein-like n=1 Tax=Haliotis rufescens TaxID=6454 RepID=UPI00201F87B4|nr:adhesive plaque matrix protein-like [Haliotis rufescens]
MRAVIMLAMAVLGCCCLVTDAFVIGSPYIINPYNQLINRRVQTPRFGRQIIYNPTKTLQRKAIKSTQVKQVAPARPTPQAPQTQKVYPPAPQTQNVYPPAPQTQNVYPLAPQTQNVYPRGPQTQKVYPPAPQTQRVYPPAPQAQNVYPPAPQAQKVYPPAPQTQNVYPPAQQAQKVYVPAPQPQYVVANGLPDHYGSQTEQGYDTQPIRASSRNTLRHQPFPQNTIIIIKEDSPNPRGASAPDQAQAPFAPSPSQISLGPFSATGPNFADPFPAPFSADPFSRSPANPLADPASAPAKTAASPRVPIPEPNSPAGAASGLYPGASQRGYDALNNMLRLNMLAEMELPHYGGHHNLHQLAETLGAPASKGAAQYQASKSSSLGHQNQYDRLFSLHLAEALDLPPQQGHPAAPKPTAEQAASPAAKPAGGPHGYSPHDLYSMHLREALDLPPKPSVPRV